MSSSESARAHRITTYNLLSFPLGGPESMSKCNPKDLELETRWARIEARLRSEAAEGAILALQEVGHEWAERLAVLAPELNYAVIWRLTGKSFSSYMGVALLVPLSRYHVRRVRMARVGDYLDRYAPAPAPAPRGAGKPSEGGVVAKALSTLAGSIRSVMYWLLPPMVQRPLQWVLRSLAVWTGLSPPPPPPRPTDDDMWQQSRQRHNQAVYATVEDRESRDRLGVACYHMPCEFSGWRRSIATLHAWGVAELATRWAADDGVPLALAGDFNFTPRSAQYALMTTGVLPPPPTADETPFDDPRKLPLTFAACASFEPRLTKRFTSAYESKHGAEPDCTNYAVNTAFNKTGDVPPFIDTLDYIFLSEGLEAIDAPLIPHRDRIAGPLPNADEPSDHLAVTAVVRCA